MIRTRFDTTGTCDLQVVWFDSLPLDVASACCRLQLVQRRSTQSETELAVWWQPASYTAGSHGTLLSSHRHDLRTVASEVMACTQQGALAHSPCCHTRLGTERWPQAHVIPHPRPTRWQTTARRSTWYRSTQKNMIRTRIDTTGTCATRASPVR